MLSIIFLALLFANLMTCSSFLFLHFDNLHPSHLPSCYWPHVYSDIVYVLEKYFHCPIPTGLSGMRHLALTSSLFPGSFEGLILPKKVHISTHFKGGEAISPGTLIPIS